MKKMPKKKSIAFDIGSLQSYEDAQYENIDLNRLAVFTIAFLQEKNIPLTFENIVVTLFRLFPRKFSLQGFAEYPDAARINRTLLQLRPKYRNWAHGNVQTGFVLTNSGKAILQQTKRLLANPDLQVPKKRETKPRTLDLSKEIKEIENSALYLKFIQDERQQNPRQVFDLLQAFPYTPKHVLRQRLAELKVVAREFDRNDIIGFLQWVERTHPQVFKERGR